VFEVYCGVEHVGRDWGANERDDRIGSLVFFEGECWVEVKVDTGVGE